MLPNAPWLRYQARLILGYERDDLRVGRGLQGIPKSIIHNIIRC